MTTYTTYTLWIVEGDIAGGSAGVDLFSPNSPITYSDLGPAALLWLTDNGYEDPGRRVVVTAAGVIPDGDIVASYDVAM
ncbi:hypothetical protein ACQPYK_12385 [Streptosporangium sp. CA-135522]|uniref:hypothetical protein n=1 Tax=Streptosporangium sp. CA-135522 TaxID=3240072 RepID=UPI003D8B618B